MILFLKPNNWFLFKCSLKIMKLNGMRSGLFKTKINKNNFKFPPLKGIKYY